MNALPLERDASSSVSSKMSSVQHLSNRYQVALDPFEGPLDLLLHIIQKERMNIFDIPISNICDSFFRYIEWMEEVDFTVSGEFMVMAATLLLIKSKMLLPPPEETDEEKDNDPRATLVQNLLEYQKYKNAAACLQAMPWMGRDVFKRHPMNLKSLERSIHQESQGSRQASIVPIAPFQLLVAYKILLDKNRVLTPMVIEEDSTSIQNRILDLLHVFESSSEEKTTGKNTLCVMSDGEKKYFSFFSFVGYQSKVFLEKKQAFSRREMVGYFLALLELSKLQYICLEQKVLFEDITVSLYTNQPLLTIMSSLETSFVWT